MTTGLKLIDTRRHCATSCMLRSRIQAHSRNLVHRILRWKREVAGIKS